MIKPKTYFEQVPLAIVRKIVVSQVQRELRVKQDQMSRKKRLEKGRLAAQEQPIERLNADSQME